LYNRRICKTSKDNESESLKSEKGEGKGKFNLKIKNKLIFGCDSGGDGENRSLPPP
jgi:hypothetical protein